MNKSTKSHKPSSKRIASFIAGVKKRPSITLLSGVAIIAVIGTGLLFAPSAIHRKANVDNKASTPGISQVSIDGEAISPIHAVPTEQPAPAPSAEPEPNLDESARAPASSITYSPKCRGAGCVTKNPSYSILTNATITVAAGTTVGPFNASNSIGAPVSWSTPQYNGTGFGPYGFTRDSLGGATPTLQYYIRAESNVAPGTYTLYLSAIKSDTETLVRSTIAVTVTPAPTTEPMQ